MSSAVNGSLDRYKWLGCEVLSELDGAAKLDAKQLRKALGNLEGRVKNLGQDFALCSDSVEAIALKGKIEASLGKLKSLAVPKSLCLLDVPKTVLTHIARMTGVEDVPALCRVNKTFQAMFTRLANASDRHIVLTQVSDCQTLTSVATLKRQVDALNRYYPNYLGEGKQWTMAEVLKRYSLRTIDFSKNGISSGEFRELMDAFNEIRKSGSENTKIIKGSTIKSGGREFMNVLSPEQVGIFYQRINERLQREINEELGSLPPPPQQDLPHAEFMSAMEAYVAEHRPNLEKRRKIALEKFLNLQNNPYVLIVILQEAFPEVEFSVVHDEVVQLFGDIRHLDLGDFTIDISSEEFLQFLREFCPRPSHLSGLMLGISVPFLSVMKEIKGSLVHLNLGVSGQHPSGVVDGLKEFISPRMEYFSAPFTEPVEVILDRAKNCTRLTNAQVHATAHGWRERVVEVLNCLAENCPNLRTLEVVFPFVENQADKYPERAKAMGEAIGKLKQLKHLMLNLNSKNKDVLQSLIKHADKIERLTLLGAFDFRFLFEICQSIPSLQVVDLTKADVYFDGDLLLNLIMRTGNRFTYLAPKSELEMLKPILQLMELNKNLKKGDYRGREIFDGLQKLRSDLKNALLHFTWIDAGMPDIPDFSKRALQDNPEILMSITRPWVSAGGGNLLEQLLSKEFDELKCFGSRTYQARNVYIKTVYHGPRLKALLELIGNEKLTQGQLYEVFRNLRGDLRGTLSHKLWEADGRPDEPEYGDKRIAKDVRCLRKVIEEIMPTARLNFIPTRDETEAETLETLLSFLKDKTLVQEELYEVYSSFRGATTQKLEHKLWEAHGKPDEWQYGENMIKKDARSLIPVIEKLLAGN